MSEDSGSRFISPTFSLKWGAYSMSWKRPILFELEGLRGAWWPPFSRNRVKNHRIDKTIKIIFFNHQKIYILLNLHFYKLIYKKKFIVHSINILNILKHCNLIIWNLILNIISMHPMDPFDYLQGYPQRIRFQRRL